MNWHELTSALSGINLCGLKLALRRSPDLRPYLSEILRRYDEYAGKGLPQKDPITWLAEQKDWVKISADDRVNLPPRVTDGGGTSLGELTILAAATRLIRPKKVFEIGTFNGRTSAVFLMNAHPEATVCSLDLPPDPQAREDLIDSDLYLIKRRRLAFYVYEYGLEKRFQQVLCDSLKFDPEPHRDTVELGFVDGAHDYKYVKSDTVMMAGHGWFSWHDYGGKGRFAPLTAYLEELGQRIPMYRIPGTTLVWSTAADLRKIR